MIGHVSPLDSSGAYAPPVGTAGGAGETSPGSALNGSNSLSGAQLAQTVTAMQINAQVAQLLRGVGGGAENNQLLQLMIGLMILITLLQGTQQAQSAADPLKDLATAAGGRAAGLTASTYTIEQTTVSWTPAADPAQSNAQAVDGQGEQIDLAA